MRAILAEDETNPTTEEITDNGSPMLHMAVLIEELCYSLTFVIIAIAVLIVQMQNDAARNAGFREAESWHMLFAATKRSAGHVRTFPVRRRGGIYS